MNLPVSYPRKGSLTFIAVLFLMLVAIVLNYQLKTANTQINSNNLRIKQMERTIKD